MSNDSKITLENFNYDKNGPRINSPNSLKACKLLGVEPKDLIKLSFDEYLKLHIDSKPVPKDIQQQRYDYYEQDRQELIKELKERRKELIELEKEENKQKENKDDKKNENDKNNNKDNEESNVLRKTKSLYATRFIEKIQDEQNRLKYEKMLEKIEQTIQRKVDKEFELEEKRRENFAKTLRYKEKEKIEKEKKDKEIQEKKIQREKKENECKQKIQKMQEEKEEILLLKQKEIDSRIEKQLLINSQKKLENTKKFNEKYELQKEKMYQLLTESDTKIRERLKNFNENRKQKEERYNQRMQDKLNEFRKKNEENQKKILNAKVFQEQKLNAEMQKLKDRREKVDERVKLFKDEQEKQRKLKFNKMYISEANQKIKYQRNENVKEYMRDLQLEKMQERMKRIEKIQESRKKVLLEKKRIENEMMIDKAKMNERLRLMMKSDKNFTKEELYEFVLTGKMPQYLKTEPNIQYMSPSKKTSTCINGLNTDGRDADLVFLTGSP